jgi:hypothetical protein
MPRKGNKTRHRKLRGGSYPPPENRNTKGRRLQAKLKEDIFIPQYNSNNGTYSSYKYTILQPGTLLQFRSREAYSKSMIQRRPMWLEYRRNKEEPSFLMGENIPYGMWGRLLVIFGPYINTIRIVKPLRILHFPVLYNEATDLNSIESIYEGYVRELCVTEKNKICADGYTLDFLFKPNTNWPPLRGYEPIEGKREICILDPIENETIEFVESRYESLGPTPPTWPRVS